MRFTREQRDFCWCQSQGTIKCYFENERVGRGSAGRTPNLSININRGMTRWEVGPLHGRAHPLSTLMPGPGCLSSWRGRGGGRGLSLPTPTTPPSTPPSPVRSRRGRGLSLQTPTTPPHPLGRGFPSSSPPSPPTSPPPLEDCSPPMRH